MGIGKVGTTYRFWLGASLGSGLLASGIASGDFAVTVRDPGDSVTMAAPTVTEVGATGLYFFDVLAAFTTTNGAGTYGVHVEVNSASPNSRGVIIDAIDFFAVDLDDLAQPGDAMDLIAGAVDDPAIAVGAITSDAFVAGAINATVAPNLDASVSSRATQAQILSDATPFAGSDIAAILLDTGTTLPAQIAGLNDPTAAVIALAVRDQTSLAAAPAGSIGRGALNAIYATQHGPAISFDAFYGAAGQVEGVNGTARNPCNSEVDVQALLASTGYRRVYVKNGQLLLASGSSIFYQDFLFFGDDKGSVDIGGKNVWLSNFRNIAVTGTLDNTGGNVGFDIVCESCTISDITNISGRLVRCDLGSGIALPTTAPGGSPLSILIVNDCHSGNQQTTSPAISMGGTQQNRLTLQGYVGDIQLSAMDNATSLVDGAFNGADVILTATILQGVIDFRNVFTLTDNGSVVPITTGRVGEVADTALTVAHGAGSWAPGSVTDQQLLFTFTATASPAADIVRTNATQADGYFDQMLAVIETVGGDKIGRRISTYLNASGEFTMETNIPFTVASGDTVKIFGFPRQDPTVVGAGTPP